MGSVIACDTKERFEHYIGEGVAEDAEGDRARECTNIGNVGMVGGDLPIPGAGETSFGGWKDSIFRNHFVRGMEGKQFFTRFKSVAALWSSGIT